MPRSDHHANTDISDNPLELEELWKKQTMEDHQIPMDPRAGRKRKRVWKRREEGVEIRGERKGEKGEKEAKEAKEEKEKEEKGENEENEEENEKKNEEKNEKEEKGDQERRETRSSKRRKETCEQEGGRDGNKSASCDSSCGRAGEGEVAGAGEGEIRAQEQEFHERMFCLLAFLSSSSFGHGKDGSWRRKYTLLKRHLLQAFSTCLDDQIDTLIQKRLEEKLEKEIEEGEDDIELVFTDNQRSLRSGSRRSRHLNQDYRWEEPILPEPPKKKPKVAIVIRCGTCAGELDSDFLCMTCPAPHSERIRCQVCYKFLGPYRTQNSRQNGVAQHGRLCKGIPAQGMSLDLPPPKPKQSAPAETQKAPPPPKQDKQKSWTTEDIDSLLIIIQETLPCSSQDWVESTNLFNKNYASVRGRPQRTPQASQEKFESIEKHGQHQQHQQLAKRIKRSMGVRKKSKGK